MRLLSGRQQKRAVLILFGGISAEHEVSIITGLQVVEQIDRERFTSHAVYVDKNGLFQYIPDLHKRTDFRTSAFKACHVEKNMIGSCLVVHGTFAKRIPIDVAYLAFHGGLGENGSIQGFLETMTIPYTSSSTEGSVVTMNKVLTKQVLDNHSIPNVPWVSILEYDFLIERPECIDAVKRKLGFPVIVKPAHLGSSIGISLAENSIQLEKRLIEAFAMDTEVLVEKKLSDFEEYNCSALLVGGKIEVSEIEKPIKKGAFLSFDDKYKSGAKKTESRGGMANLMRDLPAKLDTVLKEKICQYTFNAYKVCRCNGVVRIDFMVDRNSQIYLMEINAIPGDMSYYLWEASGISFKDHISRSIEQSIMDFNHRTDKNLEYKTDIVDKFVAG